MSDRAAAESKAAEIASVAAKVARQMGGSFQIDTQKRDAYVQREIENNRQR